MFTESTDRLSYNDSNNDYGNMIFMDSYNTVSPTLENIIIKWNQRFVGNTSLLEQYDGWTVNLIVEC